jgi:hypothetical protein
MFLRLSSGGRLMIVNTELITRITQDEFGKTLIYDTSGSAVLVGQAIEDVAKWIRAIDPKSLLL